MSSENGCLIKTAAALAQTGPGFIDPPKEDTCFSVSLARSLTLSVFHRYLLFVSFVLIPPPPSVSPSQSSSDRGAIVIRAQQKPTHTISQHSIIKNPLLLDVEKMRSNAHFGRTYRGENLLGSELWEPLL